MLIAGVILYLAVAAGMIAMAAKYMRATPPLDYHARMMESDNPGEGTITVIGALYKIMGGAWLALGVVLGLITVFGVMENLLWAKLATLTGSLVAGGFALLVPRDVERLTGVRTPWRVAAALTALAILAFVLTLF
jgi:hypothetical protein